MLHFCMWISASTWRPHWRLLINLSAYFARYIDRRTLWLNVICPLFRLLSTEQVSLHSSSRSMSCHVITLTAGFRRRVSGVLGVESADEACPRLLMWSACDLLCQNRVDLIFFASQWLPRTESRVHGLSYKRLMSLYAWLEWLFSVVVFRTVLESFSCWYIR